MTIFMTTVSLNVSQNYNMFNSVETLNIGRALLDFKIDMLYLHT